MKPYKIFEIQNQKIKIQESQFVFRPSPHGAKGVGGNSIVFKGERVLDIGTGTGILAILAAKLGGIVLAVDLLEQAVDLAKQNASLNDVIINIKKSNLFSSIPKKKFDVIIANVPQEVLSPKLINKFSKEIVTGMYGLGDGSELLIETLKKAPKFMRLSSRLYAAVYSMSGWRNSLAYITSNYNAKLLDFYSGEVKDFVYQDIDWYTKNHEIEMYRVGKKYWADIFVFELRLK